ncbi:PREDICTED: aldehyde dehydrogenase family 3 member I1, chloroplastic-like isoform X2 [Camelina sativa]|uniref:Aldehyde dehydrogenase family 3 member I1, chloroplastic-like isoform X2 n=1 Tax=Camelina sativa TaxID=90675 RepID=A0ABM0YFL3_CAMSA|nr:PREDICTED: aldehyde dehydrogenase family 3 member I1, chloroplastic-like isoform X2 [Camelina sativa]
MSSSSECRRLLMFRSFTINVTLVLVLKFHVLVVDELRTNFNTGRTKSYEWRFSQLQNISRMLRNKENCITEALYQDLSKPELEAFLVYILVVRCRITFKSVCQI